MRLFWIVSLLWFISEVSLAYFKKASHSSGDLDKSSFRLLWIVIIVSIGLGVYFAISGTGAIKMYRYEIHVAGMVIICLGLLLRWLAIFQLRKYFTVNVAIGEDHQLVQGGLYRYIRHPSYTGSLFSFLGLGIALVNWISLLIIFIPILLSFLYRISVEEKAMARTFGAEYEHYRAKTKKLIPWIY